MPPAARYFTADTTRLAKRASPLANARAPASLPTPSARAPVDLSSTTVGRSRSANQPIQAIGSQNRGGQGQQPSPKPGSGRSDQPGNPNPPVEIGPDGECTIRFADGYTVTLGRSTIVQPGFVALLTRDGLECVDPQTRRIQWVRKGLADRTQIEETAMLRGVSAPVRFVRVAGGNAADRVRRVP